MEPILVQILYAFEDIIRNALPQIKQISLNPMKTLDRDSVQYPLCAIYYEPAGIIDNKNYLEQNNGMVTIGTWFKTGSVGSENIYLNLLRHEAELHQAIIAGFKSGVLKSLIQKIGKEASDYQLVDEDISVIVQIYKIDYLTIYGDPYNN